MEEKNLVTYLMPYTWTSSKWIINLGMNRTINLKNKLGEYIRTVFYKGKD